MPSTSISALVHAYVGRSGLLYVTVSGHRAWRVPVRVIDVRQRFGVVDLLVCQPDVLRPSERDGSAIWVERARVDLVEDSAVLATGL